MQGITGATVASGVAVMIAGNGQLGTVQSSARFKDEIKPMDKTSEAILALEPLTFRYKKELDPDAIQQFGLIAEEVAKVNSAQRVPKRASHGRRTAKHNRRTQDDRRAAAEAD
jgi:hypothetical protein